MVFDKSPFLVYHNGSIAIAYDFFDIIPIYFCKSLVEGGAPGKNLCAAVFPS